jgi:hypothetical protein
MLMVIYVSGRYTGRPKGRLAIVVELTLVGLVLTDGRSKTGSRRRQLASANWALVPAGIRNHVLLDWARINSAPGLPLGHSPLGVCEKSAGRTANCVPRPFLAWSGWGPRLCRVDKGNFDWLQILEATKLHLPPSRPKNRVRPRLCSTPPKTQAPRRGFTIMEVALAATVLALTLVGMIQVIDSGSEMLDLSRKQTIAAQILQDEIDQLRLMTWSQVTITSLAHSDATSDISTTRLFATFAGQPEPRDGSQNLSRVHRFPQHSAPRISSSDITPFASLAQIHAPAGASDLHCHSGPGITGHQYTPHQHDVCGKKWPQCRLPKIVGPRGFATVCRGSPWWR